MLNNSGGETQTTPSLPDPLTTETANALISRLSDADVRALLLDQLQTQAENSTAATDGGFAVFFHHATAGAWDTVVEAVKSIPALFTGEARAFSNFYVDTGHFSGLLILFFYMFVVFGTGFLAEYIFRRLTGGWHILPPADPENTKLGEVVQLLAQRLTTQVVSVLIFLIVSGVLGRLILPDNILPLMQLIGPYLIGLPRLLLAVAFFLFAPQNPEYRLLNVDTKNARLLCKHMFWVGVMIGLLVAVPQFNHMYGLAPNETQIGFWLNMALHIYLAWIMWHFRKAGVKMMRGSDPDVTPNEERSARIYPYFAIVVILGLWWVVNIVASYGNYQLLLTAPHFKTMALLIFAPTFDTLIRGLVRHLSPPMTGEGPVAERAYLSTKRSYIRIGRIVVFGMVIFAIGQFWGMAPSAIASAGVGPRLAAALMEFLFIMALGYLLYEAVSLYINRKLAAEQTAAGYDPENEEVGGDGGGAGGSRLSTVLPLILAVSRVAIVTLFVLLALTNIGVDTTPLLAGAGIVGLALGFGAQKLVTDVVSGIFFLIDDAFRTGEYVTVEDTMGTVEKISIRSLQLRHHKGPVHTIPYGEIPKITNFSRDWVIMKLRFTVPFNTDPNKVKKIFKKIGQEMLEVPEFADDFLQPFKSQGVLEVDDVGMVIRGKFMTKPGKQFMIRKEIFNRVNAAFAENGLEFARREVRVALPSLEPGQTLSDADKSAISAAAGEAAQQQVDEASGGKK